MIDLGKTTMTHSVTNNVPTSDFQKLEVVNTLKTIDAYLYQLGWNREYPRVRNFLDKVASKENLIFTRLEEIPLKYLKRLSELLQLYSRCDQLLRKLNLNWEGTIVTELTAEYGGYQKMSITGWQHLYECLENEYFLMDMPKSDSKKKKSKSN